MTTPQSADEKRMRLRYAGTCHLCGAALPAGEPAVYERVARRVRCVSCPATPGEDRAPEAGTAGASARREYDRRKSNREQRIRERHPKLGGLILALTDEPQSTRAWERGAIGEEKLAATLSELPPPIRVLNDRRIPGTRANIDHIVVAPSGVWIVDAKRYSNKRPALEVTGGIFRPRVESLRIGGRDGTKLVDGVHKQVALVASALGGLGGADAEDVPVHGVLCFLDADWPLFGGSFSVDRLAVLWPGLLVKRIAASAPVEGFDPERAYALLAARFPIA